MHSKVIQNQVGGEIDALRAEIDLRDLAIARMVAERTRLAGRIRDCRQSLGENTRDEARETLVKERFISWLPQIEARAAEQVISAVLQAGQHQA